jgi:hypothetical protein
MPERNKVEAYRKALNDLAKSPRSRKQAADQPAKTRELEGKAAKLGLEIQSEESKAAPIARRGRRSADKG